MNEAEAKAIAATVKDRLTTWLGVPENDRRTLGVITFNTEQQSLVQDFLDNICREDSRLEWFFSDDREEPVIVKNLESIQGDERDVMLFSVTFGPDVAGKLTMNFRSHQRHGRGETPQRRNHPRAPRTPRLLVNSCGADRHWTNACRWGSTSQELP